MGNHLEVVNAVKSLSAKWEELAGQLGLHRNTIGNIKAYKDTSSLHLNLAIEEWLNLNYDHKKYGRPTWRHLAEIVGTISSSLSESIKRDHGISIN